MAASTPMAVRGQTSKAQAMSRDATIVSDLPAIIAIIGSEGPDELLVFKDAPWLEGEMRRMFQVGDARTEMPT